MSDSVDVAIGVLNGKVIATWHEPVREITFDPKNAYQVSLALGRAALEAHRGSAAKGDTQFIDGELREVKLTVTDKLREYIIGKVATVIRTMQDQGRSPGQIAVYCVDEVLKDTAK